MKTIGEIRREGIEALSKALGPVDMARFLSSFEDQWMMPTKTIIVTYDGLTFHPKDTLDLKPNNEYRITIEEIPRPVRKGPIQFLLNHAGEADGPSDWSSEHDHYLYGTPKQGKKE